MAWVYILLCADGTYYVGSTVDRERRLWEHNESPNGAGYTSRRRPVRMVWSADFPSIEQAFTFEKRICTWSRAKKEALMRGDFDELVAKSRRKSVQVREAAGGLDADGR
ncbi:GIY-YIG nuclease family protein [Nocardioides sp. C4-1]|uniref:GIY-YIG nuclease family protein n=1 Tax=Nocardioides sp. C4-1 TaxID=3151851 RepID=UPI003267A291